MNAAPGPTGFNGSKCMRNEIICQSRSGSVAIVTDQSSLALMPRSRAALTAASNAGLRHSAAMAGRLEHALCDEPVAVNTTVIRSGLIIRCSKRGPCPTACLTHCSARWGKRQRVAKGSCLLFRERGDCVVKWKEPMPGPVFKRQVLDRQVIVVFGRLLLFLQGIAHSGGTQRFSTRISS